VLSSFGNNLSKRAAIDLIGVRRAGLFLRVRAASALGVSSQVGKGHFWRRSPAIKSAKIPPSEIKRENEDPWPTVIGPKHFKFFAGDTSSAVLTIRFRDAEGFCSSARIVHASMKSGIDVLRTAAPSKTPPKPRCNRC
jgi:hypothetical protein